MSRWYCPQTSHEAKRQAKLDRELSSHERVSKRQKPQLRTPLIPSLTAKDGPISVSTRRSAKGSKKKDTNWLRTSEAAVLAHQAGELPVLTTEQRAESNCCNIGFAVVHPFEDFIVEWLEKPGTPAAFTTEQCLYLSGCLELGYSAPTTQTRFPPASQKDSVEAGKI